jgi:hypothetical protein
LIISADLSSAVPDKLREREVMQVSQAAQPAGAGDGPSDETADQPRGLMHVVGRALEARGLAVAEGFDHGGVHSHLDVTNPDAPERGRLSIGWDGYLIWERWGPAEDAASADAIVKIVAGVMIADADSGLPVRGSAGPQ